MSIANPNNAAVKRILKEFQELKADLNSDYKAAPLEDNIFEWHFTIRGPTESDFNGGIYHGRIILPPDYPFKPPNIVLLTPNGRFQVDVKICLTISAHHPEHWQPSWSIRTVLVALIGFMPTEGKGAIGSLDYTTEERKILADKSIDWKCSRCGCHNKFALPPPSTNDTTTNSPTTTTTTTTTTTSTSTTTTEPNTFNIENTADEKFEKPQENIDNNNNNDSEINGHTTTDPLLNNNSNDNNNNNDILPLDQTSPTIRHRTLGDSNSSTTNTTNNNTTTITNTNSTSTTTTTTTTILNRSINNNNNRNISLTNPSTSLIDGCIIILFICVVGLLFKKFFF